MGGGTSKPHQDNEVYDGKLPKAQESIVETLAEEASSSLNSGQQKQQQVHQEEEEEESKCPMHKKGEGYSYSLNLSQFWRAATIHGPSGNKPLSEEEHRKAMSVVNNDGGGGDSGATTAAAAAAADAGGGGGCPVKHNNNNSSSSNDSACPVMIDETNNMPTGPQTQLPDSSQTMDLSTERVQSTIPKKDGTSTWTYPSPQQFYNALARKNKLDYNNNDEKDAESEEEYMETVVALHNNMNEKTWVKVVEWEQQTYDSAVSPKLLKFTGRPHDLSPKAALKHYLLGHPLPYDRHDWTIVRDNGTTQRYVIDYYYDESRAGTSDESALPDMHDRSGTPSLLVDVRPALDGASPFFARAVTMPYQIVTGRTTYEMLPLRGTPELTKQVQESVEVWKSIQEGNNNNNSNDKTTTSTEQPQKPQLQVNENDTIIDEERAKEIALNFAKALKTCSVLQQRMENCTSEEEYSKASIDLTMCFGKILCPLEHKTLMDVLVSSSSDDDNGTKTEAALDTLNECVMMKSSERRVANEQHPTLFQ